MKFEQGTDKYLTGELFSNSRFVKYVDTASSKVVEARMDKLIEFAKGKKIIHLGFCDHLPLVQQKMDEGNWLHGLFLEHTEKCIGIDINKEAVEEIANKYNIPDIYCHDIINDPVLDVLTSDTYDYIILGEILEHIDNPVSFLNDIKKRYGKNFKKMIITVPNATCFSNMWLVRRNIEFINTDHRYWFTPYTLAKIANQAGYHTESFFYCENYRQKGFMRNMLIKKFPMLREGLVMELSQQ